MKNATMGSLNKKICPVCKKSFNIKPKYDQVCCSLKCYFKNPDRNNKIKLSKKGEKNIMWKGDNAGYCALHFWGHRNIPKPEKCQCCQSAPPLDLANISGKYKREFTDWEWLCRKCHMKKDGRLEKFISFGNPNPKRNDNGRFVKKNKL